MARSSAPATTGIAPAAIDVADVSKRFGAAQVLRSVSLHVDPGAVVALLGPSGCGKTTLLRTIAGLEKPDGGEISVGGRVLAAPQTSVAPEHRRIGMVFQDWALFPHMSVAGNVGYGLSRSERSRSGRGASRVDAALAMVGLSGLGDRAPGTLSGGQQQRVALARALAPEPAAILLDEPFSNLDTSLRVQVRTEVHRLLVGLGITTVFVTHDQEEAFVLGDEVAVMRDGQIVQQAIPAELYAAPASAWVASFVGEANLLPGESGDGGASTAVGSVPLLAPCSGRVEVLLRPEDLRLRTGDDAVVELVEFYGHDTVYLVQMDDGTALRVRAGSAPAHQRGERVALRYTGGPAMAYAPPTGDGT